jgi:hypothetical protein
LYEPSFLTTDPQTAPAAPTDLPQAPQNS